MAAIGNRNGAGNKGCKRSAAFCENQRQVALNQSPEIRARISESLKGIPSPKKGRTYEELYGPERAALMRQRFSQQRSGVKNPNMARPWKGIGRGPTSIEIKVQEVLLEAGIDFLPQHYIKPYTIDIYIPEKQIAVECDGDYWHSLPNVIAKDQIRDSFLVGRGIRVIHLTETQIRHDATVIIGEVQGG